MILVIHFHGILCSNAVTYSTRLLFPYCLLLKAQLKWLLPWLPFSFKYKLFFSLKYSSISCPKEKVFFWVQTSVLHITTTKISLLPLWNQIPFPTPDPRQPVICFLSPKIRLSFSRILYKWNHAIFTLLYLDSFTHCNTIEIYIIVCSLF
jgi:hypothetical protein